MSRTSLAVVIVVGFALFGGLDELRSDDKGVSPGNLKWYKGNTHAHSLWSDGNDFPEMIIDWYKRNGYHFAVVSDHNILSNVQRWIPVARAIGRAGGEDVMTKYVDRFGEDWVEVENRKDPRSGKTLEQVRLKTLDEIRGKLREPGKFIIPQAEEITGSFYRRAVHVNAINLKKLIFPQLGGSLRDSIRKTLQAVQAHEKETGEPVMTHLNHPNFRWGVTAEDLAHVLEERFFEVYNGHPSVGHLGDAQHASVERLWDIANTLRIAELKAPPLLGVATDDSHTYHGRKNVSPGRGWVMVRATELHPAALINAMRAGEFYASSGVTLQDVTYDSKQKVLEIRIAPEKGATYTTEFIGTLKDADLKSEPVTNNAGKEIVATRKYSADVGRVLATQKGTTVRYQLTGDELYVRATITSSIPHPNPSIKDQAKQAWTQPVGWQGNIGK